MASSSTKLVLAALLAAVAGCGSPSMPPSVDAGTADARDATIDATRDAPAIDVLRVDVLELDAGASDATLDTSVLDANEPTDTGTDDAFEPPDAPFDLPDAGPMGTDAGAPDARVPFALGDPCAGDFECSSDVCFHGICTRSCASDCPTGYECLPADHPSGTIDLCVPLDAELCAPCTDDGDCGPASLDVCTTSSLGDRFCARDCRDVGCPAGYACQARVLGGSTIRQCVPSSGACDCNAGSSGSVRACDITTPLGACTGQRTCLGSTGWSGCAPLVTTDVPDASYLDANCDGIDGDVTRGIFVATTGTNTTDCGRSPATPCLTISHGIVRAATDGRDQVFVQVGTYAGTVVLVSGISVFGGYDFSWRRGPRELGPHRVVLTGGIDGGAGGSGEAVAVRAHDLTVPVLLADLVIDAPDAVGVSGPSGRSSYGVHVRSATLGLERVDVLGGAGAPGASGSNGSDAVIVDAQSYMNGGRGGDGREYDTVCDITGRGGAGPAGTNTCTSTPSTRLLNGGAGGAGGFMDTNCGPFGSCAASGNCDARPGDNGVQAAHRNGTLGAPGTGGSGLDSCGPTTPGASGEVANGAGGVRASIDGAIDASGFWSARPGGAGGTGENGGGGGGGGGAGGCDRGIDSYGAGGGGGAAGGCAARSGGGGGGGGGGSFAIFVAGGSAVSVVGSVIVRGDGGRGGDGGSGGRGQSGGVGSDGGLPRTMDSPGPGRGGDGAHGGHGGGGAGGTGGSSAGIARLPGATVVVTSTTTSGGSPGAGGAAGVSAPSAPMTLRDGNDGQAGLAGRLVDELACSTATTC